MNVDYHNMPQGSSRFVFALRYMFNVLRTWYLFHIKYPWVKYDGFVRVMSHTTFAKGMNISIGHNVQFGNYCNVSTDVIFKNNILVAGRVCFVGKNDHQFKTSMELIWNSERGENGQTIIEDDVWLGHNVTVVGGVTIGAGSVVAAGAVVTQNIPPCEVWGGVPAQKIKNRFHTVEETKRHLEYLSMYSKRLKVKTPKVIN